MVEKFTMRELLGFYKWAILGLALIILGALIWNEDEPGFSIAFGFFGFILIMKSLGN